MSVPELSFKHAVCGFKDGMFSQPSTKPETAEVATTLMRLYTALLAAVDVPLAPADEAGKISYNVLLTPAYFMVVPRSSENFGDYGINSVGFAGSVLVRTEEQAKGLASLEQHGAISDRMDTPW